MWPVPFSSEAENKRNWSKNRLLVSVYRMISRDDISKGFYFVVSRIGFVRAFLAICVKRANWL